MTSICSHDHYFLIWRPFYISYFLNPGMDLQSRKSAKFKCTKKEREMFALVFENEKAKLRIEKASSWIRHQVFLTKDVLFKSLDFAILDSCFTILNARIVQVFDIFASFMGWLGQGLFLPTGSLASCPSGVIHVTKRRYNPL